MKLKDIRVGMLVIHVKRPEWGPGRVLEVSERRVRIFFRDARKSRGSPFVTLTAAHADLLGEAPCQHDLWLDSLPLRDGQLVLPERALTFAEAFAEYQHHYPGGFGTPSRDGQSDERTGKVKAHQKFRSLLGGGVGEQLLAAGDVDQVRHQVLSVVSSLSSVYAMLHQMESMAFRDGLRDLAAAERYLSALFKLVSAEGVDRARFEALVDAVEALPCGEGKVGAAKWTVLTLLPFIADPTRFMFLKPEPTKKAAEWLAFELNYDAKLRWVTYKCLLDMCAGLTSRLRECPDARFHPQDLIDVQSFIWVVAKYGDAESSS